MEQIQKKKAVQDTVVEQELPEVPDAADLTITDEILDEIDEVLEQNAAEFVQAYVQKGGE